MTGFPEGGAIVYCEGAFGSASGKTAHGLVRRTSRYHVLSVVDSRFSGNDAGTVLEGNKKDIPIFRDIAQAVEAAAREGQSASHLVIGLAPDGGRLSPEARRDVKRAIALGLNVDSGLHDFLSEDREISRLAEKKGIIIRDIRKPLKREMLHFFDGKIEQVRDLKVAVLGTDSAVGKRTTAWVLLDALQEAGYRAELIGTGQTAWMQGARYSIILDSLINDFVSGEIEHAVWSAWKNEHPDIILIEGQGSLMNPAYPGGFEILAAGRPDVVLLQHAPARREYDGFPGYPLHPLEKQIKAIEMISEKPVVGITVNHENLERNHITAVCDQITKQTGLPSCDVLYEGPDRMVSVLKGHLKGHRGCPG